jgi:MazG family protein
MSRSDDTNPHESVERRNLSAGVTEEQPGRAVSGKTDESGDTSGALARLLTIMATLRDPESGCPWDLRQSFETIAPYTIEEAYEVADAIEREDMVALKDELGDLLLQVVYHAQLASERGLFDFHDVADAIGRKMIRRHPHVFGGANDHDGGTASWEDIKKQEREGKRTGQQAGESGGLFADIPVALPALRRSVKLQKRAAQLGFDWNNTLEILEKVEEELAELRAELPPSPPGNNRVKEEFGDLLLVLTNLGRHLDVDAEEALSAANAKFVRRMTIMERFAAEDGKRLDSLNLDQLEALWQRAKKTEGTPGIP